MDVLWTKRSEGLLRCAPSSANRSFAVVVFCHGDSELARELTALLDDDTSGVAVIGSSADLPELLELAAERASRGDA